jgi:hypothetical protein
MVILFLRCARPTFDLVDTAQQRSLSARPGGYCSVNAVNIKNIMADDAYAAAGSSSGSERRDDSETVAMLDSELRTEGISSCTGSSSSNMGEENDEGTTGDDSGNKNDVDQMVDASRFYDDDDSKIDINSVISGNVDNDEDNDADYVDRGDDQPLEVFGKNLGAIFEDNANEEEILRKSYPFDAAVYSNNSIVVKRASSSNTNPSRPPLPPGRTATASASLLANDDNLKRASNPSKNTPTVDDKRLSVWLRVRPPVCSNGKQGNAGSVNTIEVLVNGTASSSLPTTIRTYPPLNSNAAKVIRGGSKLAIISNSTSLMKKSASPTTKSFIDDGSSDGGSVVLNAEVRGVREYSYNGVFGPDSAQSDVYNNVAAPLIEGLFTQTKSSDRDGASLSLGESALLFTVGVTNAGKTHTVMGTGFEKMEDVTTPHEDWGIIPRSLDHILSRVSALNADSKSGPKLQVYMSYLEIYNENIYDLLPLKSDIPRRPCDGPPTLKLRESRRGRIFVRGLARHAVDNVQQGLELVKMAKYNRHTASNNINAASSRSHSICQWEIALSPGGHGDASDKSRSLPNAIVDSECDTDDESVCSKSSSRSQSDNRQRKSSIIWIVDLAGSERSKRTRSHTIHQREAALINASLMNLMRCLREMLNHQPKKRGAASKGGVVPFRESKLTYMFMNHLTGPAASRTTMIVNVNPGADDYDETQHVLGYAATARNVKISAVDYNRQRLKFVKESEAVSTLSPKKAITLKGTKRLAEIVHKFSPKKRKKTTVEPISNPQAKRLRCKRDTCTIALNKSQKLAPYALKPPDGSAKAGARDDNKQLEILREENFIVKATVDDLRQQLAECENEVREEVVAMMSEQLQESKEWYENRIAQLKKLIASVQSTKPAQTDGESNEADLLERIDECEDEMKRMREDHIAEVEELTATHLQLHNEHQLAMENLTTEHKLELQIEQARSKRLEAELGAFRHQSRELQFSHDSLLAKYNDLLNSTQQQEGTSLEHHEKENPTSAVASILESPSLRKLRLDKVSAVASTAIAVDSVSPKMKRTGWFGKSPVNGAAGGEAEVYPSDNPSSNRSPLGRINKP